jgi:hypothetical protein
MVIMITWDFGEIGILPQHAKTDQPSRIWHHDVEGDGDRPQFSGELQSLQSACRGHDRKAIRF